MKIEIFLFCFTSRHATAQLKVVLMFTIAIWQRKRIAEMIAHQSERQSLLERKVFREEIHFEIKSRWGRSDWDHDEADKVSGDNARRGDLDYRD